MARKVLHNAFKIVHMFEEEIAQYTGAKYAVAVDSCTNALFLSLKYFRDNFPRNSEEPIVIPKRTYLSVPQSIIQSGYNLAFDNRDWQGLYQLKPLPIWDCAKRLTSGMYIKDSLMCLSFHTKKLIPIGKGGMILTDNEHTYKWLYKAKLEGRNECSYHDDNLTSLGYNMYMTPEEAARGLMLMQNYPEHVQDQTESPFYRDLTEFDVFKKYPVFSEEQ